MQTVQTWPQTTPDQVYTACHSTKYLKEQVHTKQNSGQKVYAIKCLKFYDIYRIL